MNDLQWSEVQQRAHYVFFQQLRMGSSADQALVASMQATHAPKGTIEHYLAEAAGRVSTNPKAEMMKGF
jgi:hypothetical protein